MAKQINSALQLAGELIAKGSIKLTVWEFDSNNDILKCKGATVPTDALSGFAVGCEFIDTDGGTNTTLYINEGSRTSCDFNAAVNN